MPGGVKGVRGQGSACPLFTRLAVAVRAASMLLLPMTHHGSGSGLGVELEPPEEDGPESRGEDGLPPLESPCELPELPPTAPT